MTSYAVYTRAGRAPVLLREGFSWWAALFGPFWLLTHAAWIPALLLFALELLLRATLPAHAGLTGAVGLGLAWLVGLHGQDLRGWSMARRGWRLSHLVTAPDQDRAYARLLDAVPALHAQAAR